jgi:hypothetical protein
MNTEEIYNYLSTIIPEYTFDITAVETGLLKELILEILKLEFQK